MKSSDWKGVVVEFPGRVPTMITPEEKQYLYWLGESAWKGKGCVVEVGPWLGGSTWCLAAGMNSSGHSTNKRLVVYDNFIWREFMSDRAGLDLKPGDSFETDFLENLSDFASTIDCYRRALPDEVILSDADAKSKRFVAEEGVVLFDGLPGTEPVEILFVDGAKSWLGLRHLLLNVTDRLVPAHSIVVCQDFKYWGNYWVPLMAALLEQYLEPIHNVRSATTVAFRILKSIPKTSIGRLPDHIADVSTNEALASIDRACDLLRADGDYLGAANVGLGKVMLLSHQGKLDGAEAMFRECQAEWPGAAATAQLERARNYLFESHSIRVAPTLAVRLSRHVNRAAQAARRITKIISK